MTREFMNLLLITLFITSCKATSLHCQIHEGSRKCRRVHAYSNSYLINKMSFAVSWQVTLAIHLKPFAIISSVVIATGKDESVFVLNYNDRVILWYFTPLVMIWHYTPMVKKTYVKLLLYDITLLLYDNLCTKEKTKRYKT